MVDNAALRASIVRQRMLGGYTPGYAGRAATGYQPLDLSPVDLAGESSNDRPLWWTVLAPLLAPSSGVQSAFAEGAREVRRNRGEEADADTSVPFWEAAKYGVGEIFTGQYGDEENAFGAGFAGALKGDEREYTGGRLVEDLYSKQDLDERSNISKALQATALDFGLDPLLLPLGKGIKAAKLKASDTYGSRLKTEAADMRAGTMPSGPSGPPTSGPPTAPRPAPAGPAAPLPPGSAGPGAVPGPSKPPPASPTGTPSQPAGGPPTAPQPPKPSVLTKMDELSDEELEAIANSPDTAPLIKNRARRVLQERGKPTQTSPQAKQEQAAVAQDLKQNGDLSDQLAADEILDQLRNDLEGFGNVTYGGNRAARGLEPTKPSEPTTPTKPSAPSAPSAPPVETNVPAAVAKTRELTAKLDAAKAKYAKSEEELDAIAKQEAEFSDNRNSYAEQLFNAQERLEYERLGDTDPKRIQDLEKKIRDLEKLRDEADAGARKLNAERGELTKAAQNRTKAYQELQAAQKAYDEGLAAGLPQPGIPMSLPSGATVEDALKKLGEVQEVSPDRLPNVPAASGMTGRRNAEAVKQRNAGEVPPPVVVERYQSRRAKAGVVNADHMVYGTERFPTLSNAILASANQYATELKNVLDSAVIPKRLTSKTVEGLRQQGLHHDLPYDTPADIVLADNIADISVQAGRDEKVIMRYQPLPSMVPYGPNYSKHIREGLTLPDEIHVKATVDVPNIGVTDVGYGLSGRDFWRLIEGESIEISVPYKDPGSNTKKSIKRVVTPDQVKIRARRKQEPKKSSGDQKIPYISMSEVKQWQDEALSSTEWWTKALNAANDFVGGSTPTGGRYARVQLEEAKRMAERFGTGIDNMRKEWLSTARAATNLPRPALVKAWDAASEFLEKEYKTYLDQINRNNYSAAFLTHESVKQLAEVLEGAARGHFKSPEELNLAVATVKARKKTKESINKNNVANHHAQQAAEALENGDSVKASESTKKADTAREEAKRLADEAQRELDEAQTAFDISISEKHTAVFKATEPFATPLPEGVTRPNDKRINEAIKAQLDLEVALLASDSRAGKASATTKYTDVLFDQTETIEPLTYGKSGDASLRARFREVLVDVAKAVDNFGGGNKMTASVYDSPTGAVAKTRARFVENFRSRRKPELIDTDGFYRMMNRVLVATLSRHAVTWKPRLQGATKAHGFKKLPNGKYAGYNLPTAEDLASGKFVNKATELDKPPQSMPYDPGMILDALERSAPQLLKHLYNGRNPVRLNDFFMATLFKSSDELSRLAKMDPELERWAKQFDSVKHAEDVTNIRKARVETILRAEKEGAGKATSSAVDEEGSILAGIAVAGGVGAAAVAGALAAGLGPEDIQEVMQGAQDHAGQVIAGIIGAGAVAAAFASRGRILAAVKPRAGQTIAGLRKSQLAGRLQISQAARQQVATTTMPNSRVTGVIGSNLNNSVPVVRIDPAFKQKEYDEKFFGLFRTNYRMRNVRPNMQSAYDHVVSYLNDSDVHIRKLVDMAKQDETALARVLPEIFSGRSLDEFSGVDKEMLQELRYVWGQDFWGSERVAKYVMGNSTLARSGVDPDRLIKNIKLKGLDAAVWRPSGAGNIRTFANTSRDEWWKVINDRIISKMDPNDPLATLEKLRQVEAGTMQAIAEVSMYDDLILEFGSLTPKPGMVKIEGGHPYIDGVYFHPEIVPEVQQLVGRLNKIDDYKRSNQFLGTWDAIQRAWKTQVTIYRPAHHIRNEVGDTFNFWVDAEGGAAGVIRDKTLAWRLMASRGANKYGVTVPAEDVMYAGRSREYWLNPSKAKGSAAQDIKIRNKSVGEMNGDEVLRMMNDEGLLHGAPTLEDIKLDDAGPAFGPIQKVMDFKPFKGNVRAAASNVSVVREHNTRIAHFVNASRSVKLPKSMAKASRQEKLKYIGREAARRTRKYHPDGLDMTPFEQRVMRRAIPFYSWMRKATPLVFNAYFFKPFAVTAYPKLTDSISYGYIGDTERGMPSDEAWTDEQLAGAPALVKRVVDAQTSVLSSIGYYGPSTPFMDQTREFLGGATSPTQLPGELVKTLGGGLRPDVRVPLELITNRKLAYGTDSQIYGQNDPDALGKMAKYAFTSTAGVAGEALRKSTSGNTFQEELLDWGVAAGMQDFGKYNKVFARRDSAARAREGQMPEQEAYDLWLQQNGLGPYASGTAPGQP